jgi:hypothetical protein
MSGKIKTTGELRDFLATMMVGVKNGDLAIDKASQITKLAMQITESFYAEVKVAQIKTAAGGTADKLGSLEIGSQE